MNDQKNKYKKYENKSFVFEGEKIFIQKIKQVGGSLSIHIAGGLLWFDEEDAEKDFFQQLHTKIDEIKTINDDLPIAKKIETDFSIDNNLSQTLTNEKPMSTEVTTTNISELDTQLESTGVFEGFDIARDSLLNALAKIQNAKSKDERDEAIQESKAVSEITGQINELAKTKVHAAGLLMKYKTK